MKIRWLLVGFGCLSGLFLAMCSSPQQLVPEAGNLANEPTGTAITADLVTSMPSVVPATESVATNSLVSVPSVRSSEDVISAVDMASTSDPNIPELSVTKSKVDNWNPPNLEVPLAFHPYDHYWMIRPVGSNYNNFGLSYYPYGSDGPLNDLRVHHGLDLANPIGVEVYAAADGTVIWADKGHFNSLESITAYGNVIVVQHDFGYDGQPVFTLYAHLSALLVRPGDIVTSGQVIGLIGNTGQVTGPHVHFEVRVGQDSYSSVRNPALWMAPYVGTGTVAGRLILKNGAMARDVSISLIDRDNGRVVEETTSYAGLGVASDSKWNENFVFGDVPVGRYLLSARFDEVAWAGEVVVLPGMTNWVEMVIQIVSEDSITPSP